MIHLALLGIGLLSVTTAESWKRRISYASITALLTVTALVVFVLVWRAFFSDPPIRIHSLEPVNLGVLCPGQELPIRVHVTISEPIIMHYYVSVLDAKGEKNIVGAQRAWTDMLHPRAGSFDAVFPWMVPLSLTPGHYTRVMAARNVVGSQKTIFVERLFDVGTTCPTPPLPH